uniref:Uncharacterized protein n=1 Tax=Cacopsylla melanoneura TaxID=428564 RepID=A0A8D8TA78_9HEMI
MSDFVSKACRFQKKSTQWQVLNAIELLSCPCRFVPEEKVFQTLTMMRKASNQTELGMDSLRDILKLMTESGVLQMSSVEKPSMNQFCGCGTCGDACGGCGRYYRVKIGAMSA